MSGSFGHRQAPLFYGIVDGTNNRDAMFGTRYHAALTRAFMVLKLSN